MNVGHIHIFVDNSNKENLSVNRIKKKKKKTTRIPKNRTVLKDITDRVVPCEDDSSSDVLMTNEIRRISSEDVNAGKVKRKGIQSKTKKEYSERQGKKLIKNQQFKNKRLSKKNSLKSRTFPQNMGRLMIR